MHYKQVKLPPRKKLYGFDYNKLKQLHMTGKEWHEYGRLSLFKTERGSDSAWGNHLEIYLDGKPMEKA